MRTKVDLETLNLYAVIPFLALTALTLFGFMKFEFSEFELLVLILGDVIFFNVTHIGLAYWQFFSLPEMKEWRATRTPREWWKIGSITFLVGVVPFLAIMSVSYFGLSGTARDWTIIGTLVFTQFLRTQHIVYQHMGLSLLYNVELHLDPNQNQAELKSIKSSELIERYLFHAFVLVAFSYFLGTYFYGIFPEVARPILKDTRLPLQILLGSLVIAILANSLRLRSLRKTGKPLFLLRLGFYPFIDWVAPIAIRFCHGIEYLVIYRRMQKNSMQRNPSYRPGTWPIGMLIAVVLILGLLFFRHYPYEKFNMFKERTFWVAVLAALSLSTGYIHFYFDRVMFQMKDPQTRRLIGPLIRKV